MVKKAVAEKDMLLGHPVKLIHYGTDCTADSARIAATEFATYSDLSAVVGPSCAEETAVAGPILLNAGIPLLSPVPNSGTAYEMANQILAAIERTAIRKTDGTLIIPRTILHEAIQGGP